MRTDNLNKHYEDQIRRLKGMFALESINIHNSMNIIRHKLAFDVPEEWIEDEHVKSRVRVFLEAMMPQSKEELEDDLDKRVKYYHHLLASPLISYEIRKDYSQLFSENNIKINGVLLSLENIDHVQACLRSEQEIELSLLSPEDRLLTMLNRVDSYNRMERFLELADTLDDKLYWLGLKWAYSDCDNTYRYKDQLKTLFSSDREDRECLMNEEERDFLENLQETVPVYRAMTYEELESGSFGVSWTLKKLVAEYFRDEYSRNKSTAHLNKLVHKKSISKDKITAYWNERDEDEVIIVISE